MGAVAAPRCTPTSSASGAPQPHIIDPSSAAATTARPRFALRIIACPLIRTVDWGTYFGRASPVTRQKYFRKRHRRRGPPAPVTNPTLFCDGRALISRVIHGSCALLMAVAISVANAQNVVASVSVAARPAAPARP